MRSRPDLLSRLEVREREREDADGRALRRTGEMNEIAGEQGCKTKTRC